MPGATPHPIVSIIQSYQQLEKNYGKEGASIIQDNCQLTIAGGFAPTSETADIISKALGTRTVPDKAARTVYYACKETILAAVDGAFPNTRPPVGSYKAQGGEVMSDQELEQKRSTPVRTSV